MRWQAGFLAVVICGSWIVGTSQSGENLAIDASFESPLPSWFAERSETSYYAGKEQVAGAADGRMVLAIEAEDLADGTGWKAVDHYPNWYNGTPSGMKMLAGFEAIKPEQNRPAIRPVTIRQPGRHRLWVRLHTNDYADQFTVSLRQSGRTVAERTISGRDARHPRWAWAWESLDAELSPGQAELALSRPATGASGHARKIDLFVLTNRLDYLPQVEHFRTQGYLRFVNLSADQEPFCLWLFVRRHQGPQWYANPGVLSRAGLSESYYVPVDRGKWLASGQSSPWVRISDSLLAAGGRNNVQMIATRKMHTDGFVRGPIRGRLEFAVGDERSVVKTIPVEQAAPRMLLTLPYDFKTRADEIKSALDYVRETEAEIAKLPAAKGPSAQHLNLAANLSFQAGVDDPEVIRREIGIIKSLGFNQTYQLLAPPEQATGFYAQHGLLPRFGGGPELWSLVRHGSQHHPNSEAMAKSVEKFAAENRPILGKFVQWLREKQVPLSDLGISTWEEVRPVTPKESQAKPQLFYYSGVFRLEGFATLARACVRAKKAWLPDSMLTYVNYSPPTGGGSWTERGTDLFLAHRHGGMEMVWTEDWLGWSAGPQHLSDVLALARSAGRPQRCRLGAYWVGDGTPTLMRMKYYTLAAGGVRDIECYDYGPWYAGIDSWGRRFDLYKAIRDCNFEIGRLCFAAGWGR